MNKNFNTHDSLEQLLQKEANKQRMYASDAIWENIRVELHGKPKWPALLIVFISIVSLLVITTIFNYPPKSLLIKTFDKNQSTPNIAYKKSEDFSKKQNFLNNLTITNSNNQKNFKAFAIDHLVQNYSFEVDDKNLENIDGNNENRELESMVNDNSTIAGVNNEKIDFKLNRASSISEDENFEKFITSTNLVSDENKALKLDSNMNKSILPILSNSNLSKETEAYINQFKKEAQIKTSSNTKWKLQFYLTPSLSYRTLDDDKSRLIYTTNQADRQALSNNVNDVVRHKPAMGIEFGVAVLYGITKNFHLKSGLQFNSRQYGIDAYRADGQASFAYVQNNQLNTISLQSTYTTKQGFNQTKLDNQLYQISMPIGVQWDFVQGERWGVSVAATLQPTYTFNNNIYVVSTDYKYYADGNPFFRRWNINSSSELFLTLKSKNLNWFFGPQIRFQQKPTYNDIYPIKEYRVDYGIKVGFTKSLR